MRRMLGLALALLLLAAAPASAQVIFQTVGPGGTLVYSDASFSVSNSAVSTKIFQYTVPAAYIATASAVPTTGTSDIFTETRTTTPIAVGPQPLKFTSFGNLRTNQGVSAAGTADLAVSFGGTTATMALLNGTTLPGNCTVMPFVLEVWITPVALRASTPTSANSTVYMAGRLTLPGTQGAGAGSCATAGAIATASVFNAAVLGTTNLASPTRLNVEWKWASAAQTNSLDVYNRVLRIGN